MKETQRKHTRPRSRIKGALPARREVPLQHPDPERGLTSAQARLLAEAGWDNRPVDSPTKSTGQIIRENLLTYFNLIFVVLALCLLLVGDWKDMTFLLIAAANAVIGIVQQLRSKRTIEKLTVLSAGRIRTVRDGSVEELPSGALVREDVVELTSGCQIPADGPVLTGQIQVNEALITGEADPVTKQPGDPLLSGSFVVSGKCRARMDQVGADSYASKLTLAAKRDTGPGKSEMMRSLDRLIRFIGLALIPIGGALFCNQYFIQGLGLQQSVVSTVAALIGMIPEGLFLLTSMALAVSVVRLAQNRTLIHEMNAIETLARVDVLCVDKTGTITSPQMQVREVLALAPERWSQRQAAEVLGAFYHALEPDNDTARAIAGKFTQNPGWRCGSSVPFSSASKWSAVTFEEQGTFVLGAPEYVLGGDAEALRPRIQGYAEEGCRVLVLARCEGAEEGRLSGRPEPIALLVLENPVRPNAPGVFAYFREQGVAVKVISGDNPVTVSAVSAQAGIEGAGDWIDARELKNEQDIARAVREYTVFGRVAPEQKRQIVRALQAEGRTVAMTGDGVNDVLALKDANCGVAMASGADAACQVAQLVLLDSDFAAMPKVVAEGRRVINNIQRSAALFLYKNIFSFLVSLALLFASAAYPLLPAQISLISAVMIGAPSFLLTFEPSYQRIRGRFLPSVLLGALPGGVTCAACLLAALWAGEMLRLPLEQLSTVCALLTGLVGFGVLLVLCWPLNWFRGLLVAAMGAGFVGGVALLGPLFGFAALTAQSWGLFLALAAAAVPLLALLIFAVSRIKLRLWRAARSPSAPARMFS